MFLCRIVVCFIATWNTETFPRQSRRGLCRMYTWYRYRLHLKWNHRKLASFAVFCVFCVSFCSRSFWGIRSNYTPPLFNLGGWGSEISTALGVQKVTQRFKRPDKRNLVPLTHDWMNSAIKIKLEAPPWRPDVGFRPTHVVESSHWTHSIHPLCRI